MCDFHLEDDRIAVAEIDDAGVFAGALNDFGPGCRQRLQPDAGGFVGAVLAPHHRENAELANPRLAAEDFEQALVFLRLEAMLGNDFGRDLRGGRQRPSGTRIWKGRNSRQLIPARAALVVAAWLSRRCAAGSRSGSFARAKAENAERGWKRLNSTPTRLSCGVSCLPVRAVTVSRCTMRISVLQCWRFSSGSQ